MTRTNRTLERYHGVARHLLTRYGFLTDDMAPEDLLDNLEHLVALDALQFADPRHAQAHAIVEALETVQAGDSVHLGRGLDGRPFARLDRLDDDPRPAHRGATVRDALAQAGTVLRLEAGK